MGEVENGLFRPRIKRPGPQVKHSHFSAEVNNERNYTSISLIRLRVMVRDSITLRLG